MITLFLFDFLSLFINLLESFASYLNFDIQSFYSCFPFFNFNSYIISLKLQTKFQKWQDDIKIILLPEFREEVKNLYAQTQTPIYQDLVRKSNKVYYIYSNFLRLHKCTLSYENTSRAEPSCFIFEGPPGVMKSVVVSQISALLNQSVYTHVTKNLTDGKDWYDSYNNEEVFLMDDVGQQGVSQWRNIINFVSPIKMPLDCADSKLKDTKFFNSSKLLLTTNSFMSIQGLLRADGISDIKALHRRGYVFDMSAITRVDHIPQGTVYFTYFSHSENAFVRGFPPEFATYLQKVSLTLFPSFIINSQDDYYQFLSWCISIINIFDFIKKQNKVINDLDFDIKRMILQNAYSPKFKVPTIFYTFPQLLLESIKNFSFSSLLNPSLLTQALPELLLSVIITIPIYYLLSKPSPTVINSTVYNPLNAPPGSLVSKDSFEPQPVLHNSLCKLRKQTFYLEIDDSQSTKKCQCIVSNRFIITVNHLTSDDSVFCSLSNSHDFSSRVIDHAKISIIFRSPLIDLAIWSLDPHFPTPFKDISHLFLPEEISSFDFQYYLSSAEFLIDLNTFSLRHQSHDIFYSYPFKNESVISVKLPDDSFNYKYDYNGLCGSVVVKPNGKILGMHVCGNDLDRHGAAFRYSVNTLNDIYKIIQPTGVVISNDFKHIPNQSGIKLDANFHKSSPKHSNYIKSPFFELFPNSKQPAPIGVNGPHTVKDVSKLSREVVASVDSDELDFARQVISSIIPNFSDITEREVILGNESLAPMNKDSSNGHCSFKDKKDCFNYDLGECYPTFKEALNSFYDRVANNNVTLDDMLWVETLKDELRPFTKVLPRSFKISTVIVQYYSKLLFGDLVQQIYKSRHFNKIMIGINPFKDWQNLYDQLAPKLIWDGDIGSWDKKMLPQLQQTLKEVVVSKYKGEHSIMSNYLLETMIYCVTAVNDDVFLNTHSMPTGHYLTALFNSFINRMLKAMWFYRGFVGKYNKKPTVDDFYTTIDDYVYGDDTVIALSKPVDQDIFNALTMQNFFSTLDMSFTDSSKKPITLPFVNINSITFLKRSFQYHPEIKQIVCPLSLETIFSSLSWLDKKKEPYVVIQDKISAFQREIYLHLPLYDKCIQILKQSCLDKKINFLELDKNYLMQLYTLGDYDNQYNEKFLLVK